MKAPWWAFVGSAAFFLVAPGTVAGGIPFWLTRWRMHPPLLGMSVMRPVGAVLLTVGFASLVESFWRFARVGLGTPAPIAPPTRLVVSGQYRCVRNPMYVAILAMVVGQALLLGSAALLRYALVVWLVFHLWVVTYEEPKLRARFGPAYEAYGRSVRRWWPRLKPWSSEASRE